MIKYLIYITSPFGNRGSTCTTLAGVYYNNNVILVKLDSN